MSRGTAVRVMVALVLAGTMAVILLASGHAVVALAAVARAAEAGALDGRALALAVRRLALETAVLTLAYVGLVLLASRYLTNLVLDSLAGLAAKVRAIGQGGFGERVPVDGPRETRELADAVNEMAASLAWREQRLLHAERLSTTGTLVAGVAHEINNPLTYLRGHHEMLILEEREALARPDLPPGARRVAERRLQAHLDCLDGVNRLGEISRTLKDLSRASHGERHPQDVNRLLAGCLIVAHHKTLQGIVVEKRLDATRAVSGNATELSQVFLNLVLNAAEAMPATGTLRVESADEGDEVVLRVKDTGAGIPEAFREKVFQPFATTKPNGTGLGLALSRRIVEAHGGTIGFASETGAGTTFTVRLPAAPDGLSR